MTQTTLENGSQPVAALDALRAGFLELHRHAAGERVPLPIPVLVGPPRSGKTSFVESLVSEAQAAIRCSPGCFENCRPICRVVLHPCPTPKDLEKLVDDMHWRNGLGPHSRDRQRRTSLVFIDDADSFVNARGRDGGSLLAWLKTTSEARHEIFVLVGSGQLEQFIKAQPDHDRRFRLIRFPEGAWIGEPAGITHEPES